MDELTLGLIGAGAVVVGGVVVYNAWQGAKVRRKMPRPMPDEAAESIARSDTDEEQPFIEPTRPVRREPAMGEGDAPATRVEPSFGGAPLSTVAPADTAVDIQAEATSVNGDFLEPDSSPSLTTMTNPFCPQRPRFHRRRRLSWTGGSIAWCLFGCLPPFPLRSSSRARRSCAVRAPSPCI